MHEKDTAPIQPNILSLTLAVVQHIKESAIDRAREYINNKESPKKKCRWGGEEKGERNTEPSVPTANNKGKNIFKTQQTPEQAIFYTNL